MASLNCDIEGELLGRVDARLLVFFNVTIKLNQATLYLLPFKISMFRGQNVPIFCADPKAWQFFTPLANWFALLRRQNPCTGAGRVPVQGF
jgi:hypothetical protein